MTGMYSMNVPSFLLFLGLSYNCGSSRNHKGAAKSSKLDRLANWGPLQSIAANHSLI